MKNNTDVRFISGKLVEPSDLCPHRWTQDYQWPAREIHRVVTPTGKTVVQFIIYNKKTDTFALRNWNETYLKLYYRPTSLELIRDYVIAARDSHKDTLKSFVEAVYQVTGDRKLRDIPRAEHAEILAKLKERFGE
jgi:hypothetical protein